MSENVVDMVNEAQKKGKFNLISAIKERAYPETTVDLFIDANSAFELEQLLEELGSMDATTKVYEELSTKADDLAKEILDSKITLYMRGVGQGEVERVTEEANKIYPDVKEGGEDPGWIKYYLSALIASNIYKVVDNNGNEDETKFTADDVMELRSVLPIDSWEVLIETMQKLTLATSYFEKVTEAGFLPKS